MPSLRRRPQSRKPRSSDRPAVTKGLPRPFVLREIEGERTRVTTVLAGDSARAPLAQTHASLRRRPQSRKLWRWDRPPIGRAMVKSAKWPSVPLRFPSGRTDSQTDGAIPEAGSAPPWIAACAAMTLTIPSLPRKRESRRPITAHHLRAAAHSRFPLSRERRREMRYDEWRSRHSGARRAWEWRLPLC